MLKGYIYKCTFLDGKVYIGKSLHPILRMKEHIDKTAGPSSPGFYEAFQKYGEPNCEIIFEGEFSNILHREETLAYLERYYIDYYDATNPKYGYNIRNTSPFSTGTRKIIDSKINKLKKEWLDKRLKNYEIIVDKLLRTKELLNPTELYFVKVKYREKNIWQKCIDDFNFEDYSKNTDKELEFLVDDALPMIKCIIETDTEKEIVDYVCKNADEIFNNTNDNPICQINDRGEIVKEFSSVNEICDDLKIARAENIRNVLVGKQSTAYGFKWKYKKDYGKPKNNNQELFLDFD